MNAKALCILLSAILLLSYGCRSEECTENSSIPILKVNSLKVGESRAVIAGSTLPFGSKVGVSLLYGKKDYDNIPFTAVSDNGIQVWDASSPVLLSDRSATVYAYYPYQSNAEFDMTDITVDCTAADQTDWLWATPLTGVTDGRSAVDLTLNHALCMVRVTLQLPDQALPVTSLRVAADGLATGGQLNATSGEFTSVTGRGEVITITNGLSDTEGTIEILFVPDAEQQNGNIVFSVVYGGQTYTARTGFDGTWQAGNAYAYTLTIDDYAIMVHETGIQPFVMGSENNFSTDIYG